MAKKIVTLYINDSSLRLLVTRGKRVKKWGVLPLEPGLIIGNMIIKQAEVADRVKQLFKSQKIRTKKVVVGVSGLHCLSRPLTLPELPKAMLAEAVTREAKRVLPVPPEQLYISWQIIPSPEGKIGVFLVAIPRQITDALFKTLAQAGLTPYLLDIKPLALVRMIKEPTAIIVDVQPDEFDIVIMADGIPQPVRTIPLPSGALSPKKKLMNIKEELSRTIEFYNSNNPEKPLTPDTPLFVSGEPADVPKLHEHLKNAFEYPVLPLPSPLKLPEAMGSTYYMVNTGLVLKVLSSGKEAGASLVNVNALPDIYLPEQFSLIRIAAIPGVVVIIGSLVLLLFIVQETSANIASALNNLDNTNLMLQQRQENKKELTENIAVLEKKITAAEVSRDNFTAAIDSLNKQGDVINGDLITTTDSLMGGISLTKINHINNTLTIRGEATGEMEVLSYARTLDASDRFSEIIIANIKKIKELDRVDFTLVLKMKGQL